LRKSDASSAQLAKDAALNSRGVVPALLASLPRNPWIAVLEVNVPHPVPEALKPLERQRAVVVSARAVGVVAGVEDQADNFRIGALKKVRDLARRLDKGRAVVVKDRPQPRFV
jgi:hypothetical protein